MKILRILYEFVELVKKISSDLESLQRDFAEYKYNLNQIHRR